MAERKQIDWEKVEGFYRAGKLSLREIARAYECGESSIRKRAKAEGWTRDLSVRIEEAVRSKLVRSEVRTADAATEKGIIEANAQAILSIRLSHREDINRAKQMVVRLFHEVDNARAQDGEKQDGENQPAEILTLPQRVDCTKKLTEAAKTLITMEREAWGITDGSVQPGATTSEADPYEGLPVHVTDMIRQGTI